MTRSPSKTARTCRGPSTSTRPGGSRYRRRSNKSWPTRARRGLRRRSGGRNGVTARDRSLRAPLARPRPRNRPRPRTCFLLRRRADVARTDAGCAVSTRPGDPGAIASIDAPPTSGPLRKTGVARGSVPAFSTALRRLAFASRPAASTSAPGIPRVDRYAAAVRIGRRAPRDAIALGGAVPDAIGIRRAGQIANAVVSAIVLIESFAVRIARSDARFRRRSRRPRNGSRRSRDRRADHCYCKFRRIRRRRDTDPRPRMHRSALG